MSTHSHAKDVIVEELAVTGLGLVASLGHDVATICAAARAGITRSQEIVSYRLPSPADGVPTPAIGHVVPLLTAGFEGYARLLRLLEGGIRDLLRTCPLLPTRQGLAFYLAFPDARRLYTGGALLPDDAARAVLAADAENAEGTRDGAFVSQLLSRGLQLAGWSASGNLAYITYSGHTSYSELLAKAATDLRSGRTTVAVVGAIDSLVEEDTLGWLEATGRLKGPAVSTGLQPGEAAAFAVLERSGGSATRKTPPFGYIERIGIAEESHPLLAGEPGKGDGITALLSNLLDREAWEEALPIWIVTDQNGETYRAAEWGHALVRLAGTIPEFAGSHLWYPATAVGDTGTASGGVALCFALRSFARGYAPARRAVLLSSSDSGARAAVVVHGPSR